MNMISKIRHRIKLMGDTIVTPEEYDQLQREWITRTGATDMVVAAVADMASMCAGLERQVAARDGMIEMRDKQHATQQQQIKALREALMPYVELDKDYISSGNVTLIRNYDRAIQAIAQPESHTK